MGDSWRDDVPIYRQIKDRVVAAILDGSLPEGSALPSVRSVAADLRVNPLTVTRAYQDLQLAHVAESRRGLGLFVVEGAQARLIAGERAQFLNADWPHIVARIRRLGLTPEVLLAAIRGE